MNYSYFLLRFLFTFCNFKFWWTMRKNSCIIIQKLIPQILMWLPPPRWMVISSPPCYLNLLCHQLHGNWYSFIPSSCTCVIILLPQLVTPFHHFVAHHIVHVPPHVATLIWICHQLLRMTIWMQLRTFMEMYQVQNSNVMKAS